MFYIAVSFLYLINQMSLPKMASPASFPDNDDDEEGDAAAYPDEEPWWRDDFELLLMGDATHISIRRVAEVGSTYLAGLWSVN